MYSRRKEKLRGTSAPVHLNEIGISKEWIRRLNAKTKISKHDQHNND